MGKPADQAEPMVEQINDLRAQHGLPPLREAPKLMRSSEGFARHLIRTDSFSHGSSYRATGFRTCGEMLAIRNGWKRARPAVLRMWKGSTTHRALMLSRSFRYVGASAVRGNFGGRATTIWVVHLGAR